MGGLPKKQTLLTQQGFDPATMLLVDAGAPLFDKLPIPPGRSGEQAKINAEGIVAAYNRMGYHAVGVSPNDLGGGLDFLQQQAKVSSFTWLSANLVDARNTPFFSPSLVLERNGLRIGIIGLTGNDNSPPGKTDPGYRILSWEEALPKIMAELRPHTDFIILLSSAGAEENKKISHQFEDIHLLVHSTRQAHNIPPVLQGNTLICQTERRGKYLGKIAITWNDSGKWEDHGQDDALLKKQEHDRLAWQLDRIQQKGDPEVIFKDKPATLNAYRKIAERMKSLEQEIRLAEEKKKENPAGSTYENRFLEIAVSLADDQEIAAINKETRKKINTMGRQVTDQLGLPGYAGSQSCFECHREISDTWQQSRHGRAYQTLVDKNQQFNASCLYCHVTGVSRQDQVMALTLPENLRNVGCESCHGPGLLHTSDPAKQKLAAKPAADICLLCHVPEHDDSFEYSRDSKLVH
ncbi:MAG: UshA-like (seleno)protein [Thermodesulfobacteriota bacterium]